MNLTITGQHTEITDALRNHIETRLETVWRHAIGNIIQTQVILRVEDALHTAEANINLPKAKFNASATSHKMYTAIDEMIDKLERQVRKHKEQLTNHQ